MTVGGDGPGQKPEDDPATSGREAPPIEQMPAYGYPPAGGYPPPYPPPGPAPYGGGYPPPPPTYAPPPEYGAPYPVGYGYAPTQGTNPLAIFSLVASVVGLPTCGLGAVVGIVLGAVALSQIKRDRQAGHGLAVAGVAVGAATLVVILVLLIFANSN